VVVEPDEEAWLMLMERAVQDKDMTVGEHELALPITLRGQIIGAIGARRPSTSRQARDSAGSGAREELTGWSDEDVALAQAITDQLAQTIESLRLLDETQRRAARERLIGEVTSRMRETLDLEAVLKTAVQEVRQALGLPEVVVRLAPQPGDKEKESSQ
jgi:GAF domain-containing protein